MPLTVGKESLEDAYKAYSEKDYVTAFRIYRHLAKQGIVIAQYKLGVMYENGQGIMQHNKHAVYCYQKAAEQGYALAQNNLGWMYENGCGIEQNYEHAAFWYRKAAEQGHGRAQNSLKQLGIDWKDTYVFTEKQEFNSP